MFRVRREFLLCVCVVEAVSGHNDCVCSADRLHGTHRYGLLARRISGTGLGPGMKRMLIDQALFAPAITATFFVGMGLLEGKVSDMRVKEF